MDDVPSVERKRILQKLEARVRVSDLHDHSASSVFGFWVECEGPKVF